MKEKALAKASDTGKRMARRLKMFKDEGVKPIGCLKRSLGCHKTEHFFFDREAGTVRCTFAKKEGCFSPFPRKKQEKEKVKKIKKEKTKEVSADKVVKPKKKRRAKFSQVEFPIAPPPPEKIPEGHKHGKHHKHKKLKPGGL